MTAAYADAATGSAPDADDALVEGLDAAVRALVRRDGVDPQRDATVVRRIAQEVVRDHDERNELTNLVLTPALVAELTERMLESSGRRVDVSRPFVDAMLPDGHRLHVILEGISRGFTAINTAGSSRVEASANLRDAPRGELPDAAFACFTRVGHGSSACTGRSCAVKPCPFDRVTTRDEGQNDVEGRTRAD